jgi:glycosyltransferase involved in cell wall biosynthesis
MNILFLFYAPMLPYVGGIQRVTENLAKEMKARNHSVYYLSNNSKDRNVDYVFPVPQYYLDDSLGKTQYYESYIQLLKEKKIDVIINQEPREDLLALLEHTPKNIKSISCFHTQPFLPQGKTRQILKYYRTPSIKAKIFRTFCRLFPNYYSWQTLRAERKLFKKTLLVSDRLCLESEHYFTRMKKYMPDIDTSKLIAVNNPNSFTLKEKNHRNNEKVLLWIGRQANTPKNVPLFLNFWVYFQKRNPEWKALIIGIANDLDYNRRYAQRKKAQNVEFLGRVDDVASYYERAPFIIMTSMYEGFPMVLIEAMNKGCIPCVFDTFESLHDIVDDGVNGIIVPRNDYRLLTSRIEKVLSNKDSMNVMKIAAREKTNNFNVKTIVDKWETIFNTL